MTEKTTFIALGENYWEKRDTDNEAIRALKKRLAGGGMTPKQYNIAIYKGHPDTVVDGLGYLTYPRGTNPELVRVVQVTKSNGAVKDLPLDDFKHMR